MKGSVNMKYVYPAVFYKDENGYSVLFSDFECATQGDNLQEAFENAAEAAAGWIMGCIDKGEPLPDASELNLIIPDDGGFVSLLYIDLDNLKLNFSDKPVKKTLTIPSWLNKAAERNNINFSATLKEALVNKLAQ